MADESLKALEFSDVIAQIAARTTCEPGKRAAASTAPLPSEALADARQQLVEDATAYVHAGGDIAFGGVDDVTDMIARASKGAPLSGSELHSIAVAERSLRDVSRSAPKDAAPRGTFKTVLGRRHDTKDLIGRLDEAIEPQGRVADSASAELGRIRRQQRSLHDEIRERCTAITRTPATAKMLSEPVVTVRAGRYVVPVRKEFAAEFAGVVHDESSSGATVYVEPMASVEANNRLRALEAAEERETARILAQLTSMVAGRAQELEANAALLAELDALGAVARWGIALTALRPRLTNEHALRIVGGRHPLLTRTAQPLEVDVGHGFDALVISGPNMGGKSVALKTIGLFCLLAYAGIPLPAQPGTEIGWFDRIACVLGDEQSIAQNLSSFSAHLQALREALSGAHRGTLVLVDEIGSGTEPIAGAALAQAFIEAALAAGACVVVTTHFTQLKVFAAATARVANASMLFDPVTSEPTYVLALGVPGQSHAFPLARTLRLPAPLIARAESLMGEENRRLEAAFEGLAAERAELVRRQTELEALRKEAAGLESALEEARAALERERAQFQRRAAVMLDDAVRQTRAELMERAALGGESRKRQRGTAAATPDLSATLEQMRKSLGLQMAEPGDAAAPPLQRGDRVFVQSLDAVGGIDEVYERDALVTVGSLKTVVPLTELRRAPSSAAGRPDIHRTGVSGVAAPELTATEIDVRGLRVDEAMPIVDKALDSASLAGVSELRIIHGKGTGQLGRGLREFLRDHPQAAGFAQAGDKEGGSGVTIVTVR